MVFGEIEYRCFECGSTALTTVIVDVSQSLVLPCAKCPKSTLQYSSIKRM